jgi:hypothetical protein
MGKRPYIAGGDVRVTEKNIGATGAKVAIWCALYKEATKVSYQVTFQDTNAAKKMGIIDAELVKLYLYPARQVPLQQQKPKTLLRHPKRAKTPARRAAKVRVSGRVERTDTELKYKDNPQKLTEYWAYLRTNGWETINTQQGKKKVEEKDMKGKEVVMRLNATELAIVQRCLQEAIASTAPTNTDIVMSAYLLRELTRKIAPQVAVGEGGKLKLNLAQCCAWLNLVAPYNKQHQHGRVKQP